MKLQKWLANKQRMYTQITASSYTAGASLSDAFAADSKNNEEHFHKD